MEANITQIKKKRNSLLMKSYMYIKIVSRNAYNVVNSTRWILILHLLSDLHLSKGNYLLWKTFTWWCEFSWQNAMLRHRIVRYAERRKNAYMSTILINFSNFYIKTSNFIDRFISQLGASFMIGIDMSHQSIFWFFFWQALSLFRRMFDSCINFNTRDFLRKQKLIQSIEQEKGKNEIGKYRKQYDSNTNLSIFWWKRLSTKQSFTNDFFSCLYIHKGSKLHFLMCLAQFQK